jgi:hypothetical protein
MADEAKYWPRVRGGRVLERYRFGAYVADLVGDLTSTAGVQYLYVLVVRRDGSDEPVLCVASEVNEMHDPAAPQAGSSGSHFLGLFPGQGHRNYGASNDWADPHRFALAAVSAAKRELGVPGAALLERVPSGRTVESMRALVLRVLRGELTPESDRTAFDEDTVVFGVRFLEERDATWLEAQLHDRAYAERARFLVMSAMSPAGRARVGAAPPREPDGPTTSR